MSKKKEPRFWQQRDRLTRVIQVPSCGWLYDNRLENGNVTIGAFRGEDEEILAGAGGGRQAFQVLRQKLKDMITLGGLPYEDLLFSDWLAILFNVFAFSYGSDMYIQRPCSFCGEEPPVPVHVDFLELPCYVYGDDASLTKDKFKEPFTTDPLPPYNDEVTFRLLRLRDQQEAELYFREGRKVGKTGDYVRTYTIAKHIVGIGGEEVTLMEALDYVRTSPANTIAALREEFQAVESGYEMFFTVECTLCGKESKVRLSEDGSFFRRDATQSRNYKKTKVHNNKS